MFRAAVLVLVICTAALLGSGVMALKVVMPEEGHHSLTWMAYGATTRAWGKRGPFAKNRLVARKDLMRMAANIARFEPVSILVNEEDRAEAQQFLEEVMCEPVGTNPNVYEYGAVFTGGKQLPPVQVGNVNFVVHPVDDLWIRDTGAVFVTDANKTLYGVDFNFNGWGQ
ncbi:hypothetical protein GQ42DRAFT_172078, partial [Ramicandelaber brevisporus]